MEEQFITLCADNIDSEHLCCAISDKKHQDGVASKRAWLKDRIPEGHVFRKLNTRGKVFIEYSPLETAWVPIIGENYLYIYCLWVSGSCKGKGYAKKLLGYCISEAQKLGKSGICILSSKKKKPFLSDKKFMAKHGFEVADTQGEYELLALSFDGSKPQFAVNTKANCIDGSDFTIYYTTQCPYIQNCIEQVESFCEANNIEVKLVAVDSLEKAKSLPCIFNNWAVFYKGNFETLHLLNEGYLKKLLKV